MNNLLSFIEYFSNDIEMEVYVNELNEGTGIRGFFNKRAGRKIKAELAEEIEMSKTIMEGIREGLDSLNSNFDIIKKNIDNDNNSKGEKQKVLDSITKLLDDSRKKNWDLNELIDEGEIDYTGFTANVGLATVAYFGVLFFPIRSSIIVHKGYNYFFNIIKNTVRKSLVMLQLNFDQFENLIITKSFQSLGYMQEIDTNTKISEFYKELELKLFDKKHGSTKGKKGSDYAEKQMKLAKQEIDQMMKTNKALQQSENAYNCLDQYNNTYTKSLETLRSYTQDDVQKQLDAIKSSINKVAGGDVDLQAYGELVIAAAEEHAYKVSSSIYNRFAKMTEVFSLPNQKKLIDLIQAATKEQQDEIAKEKKEKIDNDKLKVSEEEAEEFENKGKEIFKKLGGKIGEINDDKKYSSDDIKIDPNRWSEVFKDLEQDELDELEKWMMAHPEVLEKCPDTYKVTVHTISNDGYFDYIDSLIDEINVALTEEETYKNVEESYIMNFDDFVNEGHMKQSTKDHLNSIINSDKIKTYADLLEAVIGKTKSGNNALLISRKSYEKLLKLQTVLKSNSDKQEWYDELTHFLEYLEKVVEEKSRLRADKKKNKKNNNIDDKPITDEYEGSDGNKTDVEIEPNAISAIRKDKEYFIDWDKISDNSIDIKTMYVKNEDIAVSALNTINKKIIKNNSFNKIIDKFIDKIKAVVDNEKKVSISQSVYEILKKSIKKLDDERKNNFPSLSDSVEKEDNKKE